MTKTQKAVHTQRLINNLTNQLFMIDTKIMRGVRGTELQLLEQRSAKIGLRLMDLYGTTKYGLVDA